MTPPSGTPDHALLLDEVSWIRRLARELVADRELAEDLVQETCVVALEHAPREPGKLRAWLAEVLRNLLRQHARGSGRRKVREAAVARPEALEATDRLVERLLVQRQLVDAVVALDEPYRTTVLLRFFEELPPREIARRTGTPVATVNSRLQRALAQLRETLDGGGRAWAALLLPWARGVEPLGPVGPSAALTALMNTKLLVAAAATVVAAGALAYLTSAPDPARAGGSGLARGAPDLAELDAARAPAFAPPAAEREALPSAAPAPSPAASAAAEPAPVVAPWVVRLRVLDADGAPMPGIPVTAGDADGSVLATSGSGGWCVFETRAEDLVLSAADPRWVTVHEGRPTRASAVDPVLVLAPALELGGFVVDESGRTLPDASVRFELPDGFRTRFEEVLEATRTLGWRATSDANGRFAFERVPAVAGARVTAVLAGYDHGVLEAPLVSARDLELVLRRPVLPLEGVLRGSVVDALGAPVGGARVGLGVTSVVSADDGEFELPLARAVTADLLTAVKAGHLPARMERPGEPSADRSGWPDHVTLVLPGPALAIRGKVVDHDGAPVSGARVWVHDPTPGAPVGLMPTYLEPLMAGASVPPSALESEARLPATDGDSFFDWHVNVQEPMALWYWVVTDGSGGFELPGLDRRRYRLDVLRPDSLEVVTSDAYHAGEASVLVRLPPPEIFEVVAGRVLGPDGAPVADAEVMLSRPMIDARARIFGGNSQVVLVQPAGRVTTDGEGRWRFEDVPVHGAKVSIRGDQIVPASFDVVAATMDLEAEVRCHLEVVLRESLGLYDGISVADGEGHGLDILVLTEGSTNAWTGVALVDGRSGIVSVSSRARELRLMKGDQVIATRALTLVPGDVNRLEF